MKKKTSNCKEVKTKVRKHILDFYEIDDFKAEVDNLLKNDRVECPTVYHAIKKMAEGGCFLCYYNQVKDFVDMLDINKSGKTYEDQKTWELYLHLVARDGVYLYKH